MIILKHVKFIHIKALYFKHFLYYRHKHNSPWRSQFAIWHESLLEPTSKTFSAFLFLFNWYILASQMAQKN